MNADLHQAEEEQRGGAEDDAFDVSIGPCKSRQIMQVCTSQGSSPVEPSKGQTLSPHGRVPEVM